MTIIKREEETDTSLHANFQTSTSRKSCYSFAFYYYVSLFLCCEQLCLLYLTDDLSRFLAKKKHLLHRHSNKKTLLCYGQWSGNKKVMPSPELTALLEFSTQRPFLWTERMVLECVSNARVLLRLFTNTVDPLGEFKIKPGTPRSRNGYLRALNQWNPRSGMLETSPTGA